MPFFTLHRTVGKPLFINTHFVVSVDFTQGASKDECVAEVVVQQGRDVIRYIWGSQASVEKFLTDLMTNTSRTNQFVPVVTNKLVTPSEFFGSSRHEQERTEQLLDDWAFTAQRIGT